MSEADPASPASSSAADAPPFFRARLTPHRSLSQSGFLVVMLVFGVTSFIAGMAFLMMGAWPVFGFFGLDVALVYVAFRVNYRDARAFELIELTADRLVLTRTSARGETRIESFNPYWVRVVSDEGADGRNDLRLAMRGREIRFAEFLTNDERLDLKAAIEAALARQRVGFG